MRKTYKDRAMCACATIPNSQDRMPIWSLLGEELDVLSKLDELLPFDPEIAAELEAEAGREARVEVAEILEPRLDHEKLFRQLVTEHQGRLYRYVIKHIGHPDDAADITQQAF